MTCFVWTVLVGKRFLREEGNGRFLGTSEGTSHLIYGLAILTLFYNWFLWYNSFWFAKK